MVINGILEILEPWQLERLLVDSGFITLNMITDVKNLGGGEYSYITQDDSGFNVRHRVRVKPHGISYIGADRVVLPQKFHVASKKSKSLDNVVTLQQKINLANPPASWRDKK